MKIGLMSDTHGNTDNIDQAVAMAGELSMWIHTGDLVSDAEYLALVTEIPVISVAGNCDWGNTKAPNEKIVELPGHKIFATHGHLYGVKGNIYPLAQAAEKYGADIAVFGHSHVAQICHTNNLLIINPGSLSFPRDNQGKSFVVLELCNDGTVDAHKYNIK